MPPCFTVTVTLYKRNIQNKTKTIRERRQLRRGIVQFVCFSEQTNKQQNDPHRRPASVQLIRNFRARIITEGLCQMLNMQFVFTAVGYCVLLRVTVNVTAVGYCVFLLMQWVTVVYSRLLLLLQSVDCVSLKYAAFQNN